MRSQLDENDLKNAEEVLQLNFRQWPQTFPGPSSLRQEIVVNTLLSCLARVAIVPSDTQKSEEETTEKAENS